MDFIKALTFIPEDPRWKEKVAIGSALALLSFLFIPFIITIGYCVRLTQNMRDGKQFPLPEWDDWSGDLVRGFKLGVVGFIWALPLILVSIPTSVGGMMTDSDSGLATTLGIIILVGASCLTIFYGIFVTLMTPGFVIWFARDEEIRSGLQLSEIFQWTREHVTDVILFMLAYIVASIVISTVAGIVGVLLCIVGSDRDRAGGNLRDLRLPVQPARPDRVQGQRRARLLPAGDGAGAGCASGSHRPGCAAGRTAGRTAASQH